MLIKIEHGKVSASANKMYKLNLGGGAERWNEVQRTP